VVITQPNDDDFKVSTSKALINLIGNNWDDLKSELNIDTPF
jgi:hypothetical protein